MPREKRQKEEVMKMSEMMMLGRVLIKPNPSRTLYEGEGCAMGMALAATGHEFGTAHEMMEQWPWTTYQFWEECSAKFYMVCDGKMTLEALIDWVRSVEPEEVTEQGGLDSEK